MSIFDEESHNLYINGPFVTCGLYRDVSFDVMTKDGGTVGTVRKEWAGLEQEKQSDCDNYVIEFDGNLRSDQKALILSAAILIDYTFYEGWFSHSLRW